MTLDLFQHEPAALYHGDALELLPRMPDASVHCVATDPAYWTLDRWREIGTTTRLGGGRDPKKRKGWFETIDRDGLALLVRESARVLVRNAHAWFFCDGIVQAVIHSLVEAGGSGFGYVKSFPVIKLRADGLGVRSGLGYHGRATVEYAVLCAKGEAEHEGVEWLVLCEKGKNRISERDWPDFFMSPWTGDAESKAFTPDGRPFPTAKPLGLFRRLIRLSTLPGERVLDPFSGSGTCLHAALAEGRRAVAIEKGEYGFTTSRRRLEHVTSEEQAETSLPGVRKRQVRPADKRDGNRLF
ncbi:MAG TPA: site-specific DNA-methyltransferase [Pyrinomonadaceae bacterium]